MSTQSNVSPSRYINVLLGWRCNPEIMNGQPVWCKVGIKLLFVCDSLVDKAAQQWRREEPEENEGGYTSGL